MKKSVFVFLIVFFPIFAIGQIPTDSLKACYSFSGNVNDSSGNANHITNFSGTFTADRYGQTNSAFYLDGTNDSLVLPISEFAPLTGDFTISLWYKTNSPEIMNLFSSKSFPSDTVNNFEVQLNSHNLFYLTYLQQSFYQTFAYWNGTGITGNAIAEGGPGPFTKGEWCHFVITRSNDTFKIYRNHVLYTLSTGITYAGVLGDVTNMLFSAMPYRFKGSIDDIRMYNRNLSQAEIDLLWFEEHPLHFISPKPTDAFVQGSAPLIYWEYDTSQISDSINVEFSLNNGAWQPYSPHSHMANQNAFYMSIPYPAGTTINIKVTDVADTSIHHFSGAFLISEYDWVNVTNALPFNAKDGAGLLNFKNKLWLLGGWDPPFNAPTNTNSDVWSSPDGVNWNFETSATWPPRHCAAWMNSDSLMWVVGGDPQSGCLTDVWQSDDGSNWTLLVDTIPGYDKRNNVNYAYAGNSLYLFGGEKCSGTPSNEVWQSNDGISWNQLPDAPWQARGMQVNSCVDNTGQMWMLGGSNEASRRSYNEVWKTSDGINWTLVNNSAPWGGRYWHTVAWFDNKIWLLGGMATSYEMNDVWYSEDGNVWHELKSTTGNWPLGTRHAQSTTVFDNALWYMCGISTNNAWKIIDTGSGIGIGENNAQSLGVLIYPNPANEVLFISGNSTAIIGSYIVYDVTGKQIISGNINSTSAQINIALLTKGIYHICIPDVKKKHTFIKQ